MLFHTYLTESAWPDPATDFEPNLCSCSVTSFWKNEIKTVIEV